MSTTEEVPCSRTGLTRQQHVAVNQKRTLLRPNRFNKGCYNCLTNGDFTAEKITEKKEAKANARRRPLLSLPVTESDKDG